MNFNVPWEVLWAPDSTEDERTQQCTVATIAGGNTAYPSQQAQLSSGKKLFHFLSYTFISKNFKVHMHYF